MLKMNRIPWKNSVKEWFIDYIFIIVYLIVLFIISLFIHFVTLDGIPKYTELQSQLIALFCSVVPIFIIFSVLDYKNGTFGKKALSLFYIIKI